MKHKNPKVLFVATSRKTMGGITSVLKRYEKMEIWEKYHCAWLETQINKGIALKLWYIIKAYIAMLFIVPRFDIIHFHTVPGRSITMQMPIFLYSLLWQKKRIIHIHVGNQLLDYKNDKMFRFVLRKATKVVVLAEVLRNIMKEHFNVDTTVLYNPIEEQPKRDETIIEKNIFFAAYLTPNKGYDTLIKAFKEVSQKYSDWKLIIAGSGEIENAKSLIRMYNIEEQITMHNWLSKEQMAKIYSTTAIYCIASKQEGFPMSFLEAGSYGVPIVTTPVGGLVDVIENRVNCMIFDFDDHKMLAKQILTLIDDVQLRNMISEKIRDIISKKFSISSINNELNKLYSNI